MTEQWTIISTEGNRQTAAVTGRVLVSWKKKINPVWWFLNDDEPLPPADYLPSNPQWLRVLRWYVRNPFQNAGKYVFGVFDRNYTVTGTAPVMETTTPGIGWKWSVIRLNWLRLPFVSLETSAYTFYVGWQFWGYFGIKFNWKHSDMQVA